MRTLIITFYSIHFKPSRHLKGRSQVAIKIMLDGEVVGDPTERWQTGPGRTLDFNWSVYTKKIDVEGRVKPLIMTVTPQVDEPGNTPVIGGPLAQKIPWPFYAQMNSPTREEFTVQWGIQSIDPTVPKRATDIYAARDDRSGMVLYNTARAKHALRVEVHEVIPPPDGSDPGPVRPYLDPDLEWTDGGRERTLAELTTGTDLNIMENPAVIPILPAGTKPSDANCAKLSVTYYWPNTMRFTPTDSRLVWNTVSLDGGEAKFFKGHTGRKVSLHGTKAGEIGLQVRFKGALVAVYRALVAPLATVPYRCTVMYGSPDHAHYRPTITPAAARRQMLICNRLLWQMGITLAPFESTVIGWHPRYIRPPDFTPDPVEPGFFRANVPPSYTRGNDTGALPIGISSALNSLPYIFNFAYIMNAGPHTGGEMAYSEFQGAQRIIDKGTPSTSWIPPSGVPPEGLAKEVAMTGVPRLAQFQDGRFPHRFAMFIVELSNPDWGGIAIAHEFGHVLGLNHRMEKTDGSYDDMVQYPPTQNVMNWSPTVAGQNFDIIQAKMARSSPLLNPPAGARPLPDKK